MLGRGFGLRICLLVGVAFVLTDAHPNNVRLLRGLDEVSNEKESKYGYNEEAFREDDDKDGDDDDDDDLDEDEDRVDLVDQRQNGTENYRIRVNGLLLVLAPPEPSLPPPVTTPAPSANDSSNNTLLGGKRRFMHYEHGQRYAQRRKSSRYQVRIAQFIISLLGASQ